MVIGWIENCTLEANAPGGIVSVILPSTLASEPPAAPIVPVAATPLGVPTAVTSATGVWHFVPGSAKTCHVIALVCEMPFTVYENVALSRSANVTVAVPTTVSTALGGNGTELNAGPVTVEISPA